MTDTTGVDALIHARVGDEFIVRGRHYRVRDQRGWDMWDNGSATLPVWNAAGNPTRVKVSPTMTVRVAIDRRPDRALSRPRATLDGLKASGPSWEEAPLPGLG